MLLKGQKGQQQGDGLAFELSEGTRRALCKEYVSCRYTREERRNSGTKRGRKKTPEKKWAYSINTNPGKFWTEYAKKKGRPLVEGSRLSVRNIRSLNSSPDKRPQLE